MRLISIANNYEIHLNVCFDAMRVGIVMINVCNVHVSWIFVQEM